MNLQKYIQYFEKIAAELIDINHSESDRHFIAMAPEQVPNAVLDNLSSPILILEDYDVLPFSGEKDNLVKRIQGAFSIVSHKEDSSVQDEIDAVIFAEKLVEQTLAKLLSETNFGYKTKKYLRIENCELTPVRHYPVNYHGMRCTFTWEIAYSLCIDENMWQNTNNGYYQNGYIAPGYFN